MVESRNLSVSGPVSTFLSPEVTQTADSVTDAFTNSQSWTAASSTASTNISNSTGETPVLMFAILPQLLDIIQESSASSVTDRTSAYLERIDAVDAGSVDGSSLDLLDLLDSGDSGGTDSGGGESAPVIHLTYKPEYHFHGDAPSKEDMEQADRQSRAEFERWANAWWDKKMRDYSRMNFSRR